MRQVMAQAKPQQLCPMSDADSPLLLTKLRIPPLRPQAISRTRLLDWLSREPGTRLVLVSTPAGLLNFQKLMSA